MDGLSGSLGAPQYRLVALIGAVKRMSYLLQGNVGQ
jgi:hypothetical protein